MKARIYYQIPQRATFDIRPACATMPFCDSLVSVARKDVASMQIRSIPIAKTPTTLVQHLKEKRFFAGFL
jgi:hypothetical protein